MTSDESKSSYQPAPEFTKKSSGCWIYAAVAMVVIVLLILPCGGLPWFLEAPFTLVFGWIMFLVHNVPRMHPGLEQFVIWLIGVVLLTIGCQWLGMQMVQARRRQLAAEGASDSIAVWRFHWTIMLVLVIHAMFISGLALTGVLRQAYWVATSPEPLLDNHFTAHLRMSSSSNMKQLGLASHNYYDSYQPGQFPQSTFSNSGRQLHSWITMLLPYVEEGALYDSIDLDKPWDDPAQNKVFETRLDAVENPGIRKQPPADQPAPSHYAANQHVIGPQLTTKFADIKDGSSNTVLYGEVIRQIPAWGEPTNWRDPADGINQTPHGFGSPFPGGAQFTFVDGSVQFLPDDIDPEVLKALSTPAGREPSHER